MSDIDKTVPPTFSQYSHPRYWPVWLLFGLGWCVAQLPFLVQLGLGKVLGRLMQRLSKSRRHVTRRNIEVCFPELTPAERQRIIDKTFDNLGIGFIEIAIAYWGRPKKVSRLLAEFSGQLHFDKAKEEGKGVLLIVSHIISLELCLRLFSEVRECIVMYKPAHNDLFEHYSFAKRSRYTIPVPNRDLRRFLRHIRNGKIALYLPDQHYGMSNSVFAPFFGVMAPTISRTPEFVKMTRCAVIPVIFGRQKDGYHIEVQPEIDYPTGDSVQDATILNEWVEKNVRRYPGQYLWAHRRFKERPEGEPPIY